QREVVDLGAGGLPRAGAGLVVGYSRRLRVTFARLIRSGAIYDITCWPLGSGVYQDLSGEYRTIHPHDWARMEREGWVESEVTPYYYLTEAGRLAAREARKVANQKVAAR